MINKDNSLSKKYILPATIKFEQHKHYTNARNEFPMICLEKEKGDGKAKHPTNPQTSQ